MIFQNNKINKFIKTYESEIEEYRDEYYKNIISNNQNKSTISPLVIQLTLIILVCIMLLIFKFNIITFIISLLFLLTSNLIVSLILPNTKSNYLSKINELGYHTIEEYEKKLKDYVIGENGYYAQELKRIIEQQNIKPTTRKINGAKGEEYFIWTNQNKDKIMLLSNKINKKPHIKIIQISNIRYYRIDYTRNIIILKTNNEILNFKLDSLPIIEELIKEKRLENIKITNPAIYIDDYEIFMHNQKYKQQKQSIQKEELLNKYINVIITTIIVFIITLVIKFIVTKYAILFNIIALICLIITNHNFYKLFNLTRISESTEEEIIKELNDNNEYREIFQELKYVLGIKDSYDKVYTKEGAEYLTWVANGYFHVFLNIIYFNAVYMAIKTTEVKYYKQEDNECILRLKDKTLVFNKRAEETFQKILPNKDYQILNQINLQNNQNKN